MAASVNERVAKQRKLRLKDGWKEVRTWAVNAEDAKQILKFAAELRKAHKDSCGKR